MAIVPTIEGICDPKFERVREAFAGNFEKHGDVGAAVAISIDGRLVVDLWGGWADGARTRAWQRDTLVNVFSVGKGVAALCALLCVDRALVDLDAPVCRYWPEFAAAGKEAVTVRQLLSHRAGLPCVREPLPEDAMLRWEVMTGALARQAPWWTPGTRHGYHVNTFGFLVGEVARRVTNRSLGTVLREEVVEPLGADFHIGLPARHHHRVAEFLWPSDVTAVQAGLPTATGDELMIRNTYYNPPGLSGAGMVNTDRWRLAEIPSTNGHATARGVTRIYAALAAGGSLGGVRVIGRDTLAEALVEHSNGPDAVLGRGSRFGLGFQLPQPERPFGSNPGAFGHFGAGGSLGFADPEAGVAFGYVMNKMGPRWQSPTNRSLIDALYSCL